MILTLDIGNTNIKTALFDGKEMRYYWRMSTNIQKSSDEYGIVLVNLFQHVGVRPEEVEGIMISSVVPTINFTIEHMCQNYFGQTPLFVVPGIKTGINIRYENPRELGSDRIANAVAAYEEYGAPTIFIDFGTATTFGVVGEGGVFLGGCICPGVKLASEALVTGTAKLPRFELTKPEHVIGRTTLTNLQSGMYYGYVGLVKNIVRKIKQELGQEATVVATGGMAVMIAEESKVIDKLDGLLTLKGLRLIYERNKGLLSEKRRHLKAGGSRQNEGSCNRISGLRQCWRGRMVAADRLFPRDCSSRQSLHPHQAGAGARCEQNPRLRCAA